MEAFQCHRGRVAVLDRINVDTDQIIPKQFLKRIERTGFGEFLFFDWRFFENGTPNPEFELNNPRNQGASILVTGANFGCGSSREHAPWALRDYGFRVIIAPSFADIFYNNCFKNGLLAVTLREERVSAIMQRAEGEAEFQVTVDLEAQKVMDGQDLTLDFDVDPFRKECLLGGLDDIGMTLESSEKIQEFESKRRSFRVFTETE
jgi:3-isopropylmalate/(R)-2-methylmalate dehydratase small subunit